jgi:hypothetical protein
VDDDLLHRIPEQIADHPDISAGMRQFEEHGD